MSGPQTTMRIDGDSSGGQRALTAVLPLLERMSSDLSRLASTASQAQSPLNRLTDSFKEHHQAQMNVSQSGNAAMDTLGKMGMQFLTMTASVFSAQAALGLLRTGFDDVAGAIQRAISMGEQFLQQSFQLADQAQRMEYLWQYQYGGPQNGGKQIASEIAGWLPNFAMKSPYTLMEIMGAIGPLSQLGLSFQGLQRYLPLISDLASTHTSIFGGGGPLPISYAALAVMEATKGYSRRLLMELQIRPNELAQYGLKFVGNKESGQLANPEMFLPALEAYAKDHGYTGASQKMATETVWGLGASLTDRYQAFQRRLMGENIPDPNAPSSAYYTGQGGTWGKGTIFDVFLKGMKDFSQWWDAHQATFDDIAKWVATIGGTLLTTARGDLASGLTGLAAGFTKGFNANGGGQAVWGDLGKDFLQWITDPKNQQMIQQAAQWLGDELGHALMELGDALENLRLAWDSVPPEVKNLAGFFIKTEIVGAIALLRGSIVAAGEVFQWMREQFAAFKQSGFYRWWQDETMRINHATADAIQLVVLLKAALEGNIDPSGILAAIGKINADLLGTANAADNARKAIDRVGRARDFGNYPVITNPAPGKPGPVADAASFGGSVVQNNQYNITGATDFAIQQLINNAARQAAATQNQLAKTPGGLQYNTVGLF
jgi:hypothetical protein